MDRQHLKIAITNLAKFHAAGFLVKQTNFDYLCHHQDKLQPLNSKIDSTVFSALQETQKNIETNPNLRKHLSKIEAAIKDVTSSGIWRTTLPLHDPWSSIVHGDLWINNLLFCKNIMGEVEDVKIIDFQTYHISSPLKDLLYLVMVSAELALIEKFDEFFLSYQDLLVGILKRHNCYDERFSSSLDKQLAIDAKSMFVHILWVTRFFSSTDQENSSINNNIVDGDFSKRVQSIILFYLKKKWI